MLTDWLICFSSNLSNFSCYWRGEDDNTANIQKNVFIPKFPCEAWTQRAFFTNGSQRYKGERPCSKPREYREAFITRGSVFLLIPKWALYKFLLLRTRIHKGRQLPPLRTFTEESSVITQTWWTSQLWAWRHHLGSCFRLMPLGVPYIDAYKTLKK